MIDSFSVPSKKAIIDCSLTIKEEIEKKKLQIASPNLGFFFQIFIYQICNWRVEGKFPKWVI